MDDFKIWWVMVWVRVITGVCLGLGLYISITGLETCGTLVANVTMFSHLLPGFSCGSKHVLLP